MEYIAATLGWIVPELYNFLNELSEQHWKCNEII